ncbi:MAG TPA: LLM class F420-dependent oxidoreductase [Candidatus Saccharimonadales bacterium]|nr:LLM class F420-dependent oxidoreductase [Candidatus Saccharimonadales bacterium]
MESDWLPFERPGARTRLGLALGYWGAGPPSDAPQLVGEAERLGFDSMWTSEAYGSDALTPLAWWGSRTRSLRLGTAVAQIHARTPAATAMAAATLDHLSGGRFVLGLGASGPQVVEGWHGASFEEQLQTTREYVAIIRRILRRQGPLEFSGERYRLPRPGGRGKSIILTVHPRRADLPIWLAAEGPKNTALAAEIADGWLAGFHAPKASDWQRRALAAGFARRDPSLDASGFEIAASLFLAVDDDLERAADRFRPLLALYIGGMGGPRENFHFDLFCRMGLEQEATRVRDLYLAGDRAAAVAAVSTRLVEEVALVGPLAKVREESELWRASLPTLLLVGGPVEQLQIAAELFG